MSITLAHPWDPGLIFLQIYRRVLPVVVVPVEVPAAVDNFLTMFEAFMV